MGLSDPGCAHITLGNRADIRCRLTGPGAEGGMGVRTGMLVMTIRRRGVGKGTARRHERQHHIHPDDSECEAGNCAA